MVDGAPRMVSMASNVGDGPRDRKVCTNKRVNQACSNEQREHYVATTGS